MLIFAGTVSQSGRRSVVSFLATPTVDHSVMVADDAVWGPGAGYKGVQLAQCMLSQVAIAEVAEKYAKIYSEEVLEPLTAEKGWHIIGDQIRRWLDLKLLSPDSAIPIEHSGLVQ